MIIVTASERKRLVKVTDGTRNVDWVFESERQMEDVLHPAFLRQLFVHQPATRGDRFRVVAKDEDRDCFVDSIILGTDKATGFISLADLTSPGRPFNGVTIRYGATPDASEVAVRGPVGGLIDADGMLTADGRTDWNVGKSGWDVVVGDTVVVTIGRDQHAVDKDGNSLVGKTLAQAIAKRRVPIPEVKAAA